MYPEPFVRCLTKLTRADVYHWYTMVRQNDGLGPMTLADYCHILTVGPGAAVPLTLAEYELVLWCFLTHEDYYADYG